MSDLVKFARRFIEAIPHARTLGMELTDFGGGFALIKMPYAEKLIGDPVSQGVHGGAISRRWFRPWAAAAAQP